MSSFKDARIAVRQNKLSRLSQQPVLSIDEVSYLASTSIHPDNSM